MRVSNGRATAGALAAALLLTLIVLTAGAARAATHEVSISGFAFNPATLNVAIGDTVTWTNEDTASHTATSSSGAFDSGNLANGATFSHTFATAGIFAYSCAIHPNMTGSVVVAAASGGGSGSGSSNTPVAPRTGMGRARAEGGDGIAFAAGLTGASLALAGGAALIVTRRR